MVLLSMPMTLTMLLREHHAIDWPGVRWIAIGRIPGTMLGLVVLWALPEEELAFAIGLAILLGVVLSMVHPGITVRRRSAFGAGTVARTSRTRRRAWADHRSRCSTNTPSRTRFGPRSATSFLIAAAVSGTALAITGKLSVEQLKLTRPVPARDAGRPGCSRDLSARRLSREALRPIVLSVAAIAGLIAMVRGLLAF